MKSTTHLLQNLRGDGHHGVDRVSDDGHDGLGRVGGHADGQVAHDGSVRVEQVVAGHAGFAGHASGDDHEVRA